MDREPPIRSEGLATAPQARTAAPAAGRRELRRLRQLVDERLGEGSEGEED